MPDDGLQSRRCTTCAINWPVAYKTCPTCEGETWESTKPAIDDAEAHSLKTHAEFDRYCAKRDAMRQRVIDELDASLGAVTVDGPSAA